MKKFTYVIILLFISFSGFAQNGLEKIIVEKYYISDAADAAGSVGTLPQGSVTYRIFVDMLPGYKFQALYGVNTPGEEHELRIETTTTFFNNEDRGSTSPTFTKTQARNNTVMLDSWFSVGGAASGQFGVLKDEDDGDATVINADNLLQNNDPAAGIPLTQQDGMLAVSGVSPQSVTFVGLTTELDVFDNESQKGNLFTTDNGSIAALNGAVGPTVENRVLVGQFTTDGDFSFELNVQIGTPEGGVENYVARNPVGIEKSIASLIYPGTVHVPFIRNNRTATLLVDIFPNPANTNITLLSNIEQNITCVDIFNLIGEKISSHTFENLNQATLNVASLTPGIYVIRVTSGTESSTARFIKE